MSRRIVQYDSIRLWSTFFIILGHLNVYIVQNSIGDGKPLINIPLKSGDTTAMAVSLFFILSGASLMVKYGESNQIFNIKKYFLNRFLGVYPCFWGAWVLIYGYMFATGNLMPHLGTIPKWKAIFTVFAVDGFFAEYFGDNFYLTGEWFLGTLIIIYIIFPLLLKLKKRSTVLFVALLIICYFLGVYLKNVGINPYTFPLTRLMEFGLGMLFTEYRDKLTKAMIPMCIVALCVLTSLFIFEMPIFYMHIYLLLGISAFILFYFISDIFIRIKIYADVCTRFSAISFSVYLLHHHLLAVISSKYFGYPLLRREMYMMLLIEIVIIVFLGYWHNDITKKLIRWLKSYCLEKVEQGI